MNNFTKALFTHDNRDFESILPYIWWPFILFTGKRISGNNLRQKNIFSTWVRVFGIFLRQIQDGFANNNCEGTMYGLQKSYPVP